MKIMARTATQRVLIAVLGIAGWLAVYAARPASAAECSSECECSPCRNYDACTIFCSAGSGAFCTDGACGTSGSLQAKCCCTAPDPVFGIRFTCSYKSCGLFAPNFCEAFRREPSASSFEPSLEDGSSWALSEFTVDRSGRVLEARERFTSPGYRGELPQGSKSLSGFGPGHYEIFSFEPPEGSSPTRGRKLVLKNQGILATPGARSARGEIAMRLETAETGQLRLKDVLFSSSPGLRRWLPDLIDLLAVKSPGEDVSSTVDVVFIKVAGGGIETLTVSHYQP